MIVVCYIVVHARSYWACERVPVQYENHFPYSASDCLWIVPSTVEDE